MLQTRLARYALPALAALLFALPACGRYITKSSAEAALVGVWEDEGGAQTRIEVDGENAVVVEVIDYDEEVFEVLGSGWDGRSYSWDYRVPSTGYIVTHEVETIQDSYLELSWMNDQGGSGLSYMRRVQ